MILDSDAIDESPLVHRIKLSRGATIPNGLDSGLRRNDGNVNSLPLVTPA